MRPLTSSPAEPGSGGSLIHISVLAQLTSLIARKECIEPRVMPGPGRTYRPISHHEARVNTPQNINKPLNNNRHTWCSTTSLLEVHNSFRKAQQSLPQRISRPVSSIGISNRGEFASALFRLREKRISSMVYAHIFTAPSSLTPLPTNLEGPSPTSMAMTPGIGKQALPSSKSLVINNEKPTTFRDWRSSLHELKILYLKRQWKECKSRCDWLLENNPASPHLVHLCYVQFHSALCDELVATAMHKHSNAKIPLLESSRAAYAAALKTLSRCGDIHFDDDETLSEEDLSFVSEITSQQYTPTPSPGRLLTAPPSPPWNVSPPPALTYTEHPSPADRFDVPTPAPETLHRKVPPAPLQPETPSEELGLPASVSPIIETAAGSLVQKLSLLHSIQQDSRSFYPERSTSLHWVPPSTSWTTDVGFGPQIHLPSPLRPLHAPSESECVQGHLYLPESISWTTNFTSSPVHRPSPLHIRSESAETITPTKQSRKPFSHVRSDSTETVTPTKQRRPRHFSPSQYPTPQTPPDSPKYDEQVSPKSLTPTPAHVDQVSPRSSSPILAMFTMSARTNTSIWMLDCAQRRFDILCSELAPMLEKHIEAVDAMIENTVEVRRNSYANTIIANLDDGGIERHMNRQARIARLRARGWKRERFNPERYEELCAKALAEL